MTQTAPKAVAASGDACVMAEASLDGRRLRSADSRRRIVDALFELVQQGDLEPSAEAVADRAQVGLRSVFRHFKDMEGLRREISALVETRIGDLLERPLAGVDWRARLISLIDRRAEVFEQVMPYRRAGNAQRHRSSVIQQTNLQLNGHLRQVLFSVIPEGLSPETREALDFVVCLDSWIRLRVDQGLAPEAARAVVIHTVEALVATTRLAG